MRRRLVFILTNVLSIACLWWVLHDQKWAEFWEDLRTLHWGWVILAVVSDIAVYVVHGWRWSLLLKPIEEIPMWRSVQAIYVGLFANEILPFRTGELIKSFNAEGMTVLVVEHDMAFVRQIAQRVTVLHLGKIFARGDLEAIIQDEKVAEIYLGKTHVH